MSLKSNNIVYVMHSSSKYEGSNKSLLAMLDGAITKGIIPFVIMPIKQNMTMSQELTKRNIPHVKLRYFIPQYPTTNSVGEFVKFLPRLIRTILFNYLTLGKVVKYAKSHHAALIHTNAGPMLMGQKAAIKIGIPHVWHLREYQDLDFKLPTFYSIKQFTKKLRHPINHTIAISKGIFNHFKLLQSDRMIYNGILSATDTQFLAEKEKHFLFAGSLTAPKGIKNLILAFADFSSQYPDYELHIAGDALDENYKQHLVNLLADKGIAQKVKFLGHRDDVPALMAKATALVVPSAYEAFGRITAEAMFNGCYVIGNNTGGTKEIIEAVGLGRLYSGHDDLVKALTEVAHTGIEQYYAALLSAQDKAVELFSREQNIEKVYSYYQEILNRE